LIREPSKLLEQGVHFLIVMVAESEWNGDSLNNIRLGTSEMFWIKEGDYQKDQTRIGEGWEW